MSRRNSNRRPSTGFTLMEVLLVLVILVVLGAIAIPIYNGVQERADKRAAEIQVRMFEQAIDMYKLDAKKYPSALNDLIERPSDLKEDRWSGPYLKDNRELSDPWDHPYNYSSSGSHNPNSYDVWSVGPDGQDASGDDIGNWKM